MALCKIHLLRMLRNSCLSVCIAGYTRLRRRQNTRTLYCVPLPTCRLIVVFTTLVLLRLFRASSIRSNRDHRLELSLGLIGPHFVEAQVKRTVVRVVGQESLQKLQVRGKNGLNVCDTLAV